LALGRLGAISPSARGQRQFGVLVFLVSVVTVVGLFALHLDYILFPAFAGFMVAGQSLDRLHERAYASRKASPSTCGT
jgi:hypothetical protein